MERHAELEKLEKSLIEVRDLFIKISTLVMEQGELVQVVEYHAQQASTNVDKAEKQLEKARELKIKSLKVSTNNSKTSTFVQTIWCNGHFSFIHYLQKKTCILIWVAVILTVLVLILLFL